MRSRETSAPVGAQSSGGVFGDESPGISTLRRALLGEAAGGNHFENYRRIREQKNEQEGGTGVYRVATSGGPVPNIRELEICFRKGDDLQTVANIRNRNEREEAAPSGGESGGTGSPRAHGAPPAPPADGIAVDDQPSTAKFHQSILNLE